MTWRCSCRCLSNNLSRLRKRKLNLLHSSNRKMPFPGSLQWINKKWKDCRKRSPSSARLTRIVTRSWQKWTRRTRRCGNQRRISRWSRTIWSWLRVRIKVRRWKTSNKQIRSGTWSRNWTNPRSRSLALRKWRNNSRLSMKAKLKGSNRNFSTRSVMKSQRVHSKATEMTV